MQLADLPHGLIENSGDDPAVSVRRRTNEAPLQTKAADEALVFLVENELQPETGFVGGTATKAIVGELLFPDLVTMNSFVPGHVVKMNESEWKCKRTLFAVRDSLFADPLHIVIPSGVRGRRRPNAVEGSAGIPTARTADPSTRTEVLARDDKSEKRKMNIKLDPARRSTPCR